MYGIVWEYQFTWKHFCGNFVSSQQRKIVSYRVGKIFLGRGNVSN